jgi:hypothetical protein
LGFYNYREIQPEFQLFIDNTTKNTYSIMGNSTSQQDKLQLTQEDTPKTIKLKLKGCQPELLQRLCFSGIRVTEDILTHCHDLMNLKLLEFDHCRLNPEINLEYHPILEVLILRFTCSKFLNLGDLRIKVSERPDMWKCIEYQLLRKVPKELYTWKLMNCGLIKIL